MQPKATPSGRRLSPRWSATFRLGAVASVAAAALAVLVYSLTPVPGAVIVVLVGLGAFLLSWHTSSSRPSRGTVVPGPGTVAHARRRRRRAARPAGSPTGGLPV